MPVTCRLKRIAGLKNHDIVVVIVEAKEDSPAGPLLADLHSENIAIEVARNLEVANSQRNVAGTLDGHACTSDEASLTRKAVNSDDHSDYPARPERAGACAPRHSISSNTG